MTTIHELVFGDAKHQIPDKPDGTPDYEAVAGKIRELWARDTEHDLIEASYAHSLNDLLAYYCVMRSAGGMLDCACSEFQQHFTA